MDWPQLAPYLTKKLQGEIMLREPMKNHTTWKIGGPADMLVIPQCTLDVTETIIAANQFQIPVTVIGNGSNLLVRDGGIRGIVLKINQGMNKVNVSGTLIEAEAGVMLPKIARVAARYGLTGLEFATGIPATLGGAIIMNAGALGGETGKFTKKIAWIDAQGTNHFSDQTELEFSYRRATLPQKNMIIIKAWLELEPGETNTVEQLMTSVLNQRNVSQPVNKPSAGSVFRNPANKFAGKLIEETGLKGTRIGDAQVSDTHANFIINMGQATAGNVLRLIAIIRNKVWEKFGVNLELEIKILGEDLLR